MALSGLLYYVLSVYTVSGTMQVCLECSKGSEIAYEHLF